MANSFVRYTGNGTTTTYAIPFSYRSTDDLSATVAGVNVTAYTLDAAGTNLTFTTAPANGAAIEIRRTTSQSTKLVDYVSGSVLTENDLDTDSDQAFYMSQEAIDKAGDVISLDNVDFNWNVQNKRLKNVADPVDNTDAVNKQFISTNLPNITTVAGISSDVTTVAGISSDVTAVAADATDIGTVSANIASVNTVATNINDVIKVADDLNEAISEVETVANDLNEATSEIEVVANNITNVNTVGTNIANVNTVAGIDTNVTTVAGISSDVTSVAGISTAVSNVNSNSTNINAVNANSANINTVAGINTDVTSVAGISSAVTAVNNNSSNINAVNSNSANINTVAGNSTNINTVAGNNSNITTVAGISSNVTTVAGISSDVTAVAGDATDIGTVATNLTGTNTIGTVAGSIANVNNVGGSIANVNTVATNIASVNNFGEVYRISATAPTTSLDAGDLYFDTATDTLKVYGSSGWQNAGSSVNGTSQRYNYTATSGQTTFTGADNNGNTLTYDAGYIDVYLNGVKLLNGTDVTVTSGSSVVLASGATTGDVVDIVAYGTFSVASLNADNLDSGTVSSARISGAYTGITNLTMSGDLTINTDTLFVDASADKVGIGTATPDDTLHVNSGGQNDVAKFESTDTTASLILVDSATTTDGNRIQTIGNTMNFQTGGSEAMRINASQQIGIGTASPSARVNILESTVGTDPTADSSNFIKLTNNDIGTTNEVFGIGFSSLSGSTDYLGAFVQALGNYSLNFNHSLIFGTRGTSGNATERMRIDSSGNVGIGTTSPTTELRVIGQISTQSNTNQNGFSQNCIGTPANYYFDVRDDNTGIFRIISNKRIQTNGGTSMLGHLNLIGERGQNYKALAFEHTGGGGEVGSITTTSSSTSFNTSSDYRLKENVNYDFDATSRLKQLKPARFNFISDANTTVDGFLAHEVSSVVPEAITGTKDAVQVWEEGDELPEGVSVGDNKLDENGNTIPEYQGIDQSKLVPLLVKTIQELEARITTLENA